MSVATSAAMSAATSVATSVATDVAIIGAGLTGLVAARQLQKQGRKTKIFDKGRSPGGRIATRRFEGGVFDHGAQLFKFTSEGPTDPATELLNDLRAQSALRRWGDAFCCEGAMTALPKAMAQNLDVTYNEKLLRLERIGTQWRLHFESGRSESFEKVLLTAPVPQCLDILESSQLSEPDGLSPLRPPSETLNRLRSVQYDMCLVGLLILDGPSGLPEPGWREISGASILWIADNMMKGISPAAVAITVHMSPEFSAQHFDRDETETLNLITRAAAEQLKTPIRHAQLKKWRYSQASRHFPEAFSALWENLWIAGDAFVPPGGPKNLEAAARSGLAVSQSML